MTTHSKESVEAMMAAVDAGSDAVLVPEWTTLKGAIRDLQARIEELEAERVVPLAVGRHSSLTHGFDLNYFAEEFPALLYAPPTPPASEVVK
jgi:hypothetical protein